MQNSGVLHNKNVFYVAIGCIFLIGAFVDIFMHICKPRNRVVCISNNKVYLYSVALTYYVPRLSQIVLAAVFFQNRIA